MTHPFWGNIKPVKYEGPESRNLLAFRYYNKDQVVLGKRMEDHLRFAVAYWHSFAWGGGDPFGNGTFLRPWFNGSDELELAKVKADVAFDLFQLLGVPFYCFHDRDVAPEGKTLAESNKNVRAIADIFARKQEETGVKLLWGTANLFSNPRYMAGASTNPDPEVYACAALQVRDALEATQRLGGAGYVLWGGREGYETLLNTDLKRELAQMGRFLQMVVEHKYKIGFDGLILIEPKPMEPSKHQYDFDTATVYGFLVRHGLEKDFKLNIEANHATLSGHTFEHDLQVASDHGLLGSIDANRGNAQNGWDTDQFPTDLYDTGARCSWCCARAAWWAG